MPPRGHPDLEEAGAVIVPVGEGADREVMAQPRAWRRRAVARQGGTPGGGEQPIRRRRTERAQQVTSRCIAHQFVMPFKGINERGESGDEALTAHPARDLPETNKQTLDDGRGPLRAGPDNRPTTRRRWMTQEGDRVFAMRAGGGDELIEDTVFVRAGRGDIARRDGRQQLAFALHAHHRLVFLPCPMLRGMGQIYS